LHQQTRRIENERKLEEINLTMLTIRHHPFSDVSHCSSPRNIPHFFEGENLCSESGLPSIASMIDIPGSITDVTIRESDTRRGWNGVM